MRPGGALLYFFGNRPYEAHAATGKSVFLLGPLRQAAGVVAGGSRKGAGWSLASLGGRTGAPRRSDRPLARNPRDAGRLASGYRRWLRYRGDRDCDVVAARRTRCR